MQLADRDLTNFLEVLDFETANSEHPFDADTQVQPASIDLRLDRIFWKPRRRKAIDLRKSHLLELQPRRFYKRVELKPSQSIVIRPNQLLLGRVYEKFTIPSGLATFLVGRSSFCRLGLMIHASGGFINPGYRGHMTLQLFNLGPNPIRIFPYLPICQAVFTQLSNEPVRLYGEHGLQSKYVDDDGGPSYWWRDKRIRQLHRTLSGADMALGIQQELINLVEAQEPEVLARLERFIERQSQGVLDNAASVLESFSRKEDRRRFWRRIAIGLGRGVAPFLSAATISSFFVEPFEKLHHVLWIATALSLLPAYLALRGQVGDHLGQEEARKLVSASRDEPG